MKSIGFNIGISIGNIALGFTWYWTGRDISGIAHQLKRQPTPGYSLIVTSAVARARRRLICRCHRQEMSIVAWRCFSCTVAV